MAKVTTTPKFEQAEIVREGDKIILPTGMSYADGMKWLARMEQQEEEEIVINEIVNAYALDGAIAFTKALTRRFGWTSNKPSSWFSSPPAFVGVPISPTETMQVIWGEFSIPNMSGHLQTAMHISGNRLLFKITGVTQRKHAALVAEIAALTRQIAREESIYKGKAIRASFKPLDPRRPPDPIENAPKFLDLSNVSRDNLILPAVAHDLVETALLAPIRYSEACRLAGIPLKRGILLEGPFGVGKTLTANVTAKVAEQNGWTFLLVEDVTQLDNAIQFGKMYQPCVIFAEDIDRAKDENSDYGERDQVVNSILNTIDGIDSKNAEIMVVVTTNNVESINQAMLRPGRFDAVIPVRHPDASAAQALVRLFGRQMVPVNANLTDVGEALQGNIPAVIREVVERAKLSAINRTGGLTLELLTISPDDLLQQARGMSEHLRLLEVRTPDTRSDYEKAAGVIAAALTAKATPADPYGTPYGTLARHRASVPYTERDHAQSDR